MNLIRLLNTGGSLLTQYSQKGRNHKDPESMFAQMVSIRDTSGFMDSLHMFQNKVLLCAPVQDERRRPSQDSSKQSPHKLTTETENILMVWHLCLTPHLIFLTFYIAPTTTADATGIHKDISWTQAFTNRRISSSSKVVKHRRIWLFI